MGEMNEIGKHNTDFAQCIRRTRYGIYDRGMAGVTFSLTMRLVRLSAGPRSVGRCLSTCQLFRAIIRGRCE